MDNWDGDAPGKQPQLELHAQAVGAVHTMLQLSAPKDECKPAAPLALEIPVTEGNKMVEGDADRSVEPLRALAESLERALDSATSVVLMRHSREVCTVYLGDPSGPREELRRIRTIPSAVADEILKLTSSGPNRVQIGDQLYRFVRTFTQVGETAAIVFSI